MHRSGAHDRPRVAALGRRPGGGAPPSSTSVGAGDGAAQQQTGSHLHAYGGALAGGADGDEIAHAVARVVAGDAFFGGHHVALDGFGLGVGWGEGARVEREAGAEDVGELGEHVGGAQGHVLVLSSLTQSRRRFGRVEVGAAGEEAVEVDQWVHHVGVARPGDVGDEGECVLHGVGSSHAEAVERVAGGEALHVVPHGELVLGSHGDVA